jgi:hypothetical protein
MNDMDIIKKSYENLVQEIFSAYWDSAFIAKPSPTQLRQAEAQFQKGITQARQARDRSIALLPP